MSINLNCKELSIAETKHLIKKYYKQGVLYKVLEQPPNYNMVLQFPLYDSKEYQKDNINVFPVYALQTNDVFFLVGLTKEHLLGLPWLEILFNKQLYACHPNIFIRVEIISND